MSSVLQAAVNDIMSEMEKAPAARRDELQRKMRKIVGDDRLQAMGIELDSPPQATAPEAHVSADVDAPKVCKRSFVEGFCRHEHAATANRMEEAPCSFVAALSCTGSLCYAFVSRQTVSHRADLCGAISCWLYTYRACPLQPKRAHVDSAVPRGTGKKDKAAKGAKIKGNGAVKGKNQQGKKSQAKKSQA